MNLNLNDNEKLSVKKSFFNIYFLFLNQSSVSPDVVDCLIKWGLQLGLSEEELKINKKSPAEFVLPNKQEALEQVFDLVYFIYQDGIVEDVELNLASQFAEKLGFPPYIVGDLLKAIVTAPHDGSPATQVRKELHQVLQASLNQ